MQKDVSLLFVKEYLARGAGNEHPQKNQRHRVREKGKREYRLPDKRHCHHSEQRVEQQRKSQSPSDRFWRLVLPQPSRRSSTQKQRQKQSAQRPARGDRFVICRTHEISNNLRALADFRL